MANSDRTEDLPEMVSRKGACEILGVDPMTLKRWRDSGWFDVVPAIVGRDPVWTRADIERFAEEKGRQRARAA